MSESKELPIFLGEGDEQIQIGNATIEHWHNSENYYKIMGEIDAFPGARLTFSRIVNWEEVIVYTKSLYPKKENVGEPNPPTEEEKKLAEAPPKEVVDRIKDAVRRDTEEGKN